MPATTPKTLEIVPEPQICACGRRMICRHTGAKIRWYYCPRPGCGWARKISRRFFQIGNHAIDQGQNSR
jgi:hypothetical protein